MCFDGNRNDLLGDSVVLLGNNFELRDQSDFLDLD